MAAAYVNSGVSVLSGFKNCNTFSNGTGIVFRSCDQTCFITPKRIINNKNLVRNNRVKSSIRMSSGNASAMPLPKHRKSKRVSLLGIAFLLMTAFWAVVLFVFMLAAHPFVKVFDEKKRRFHDFVATNWAKLCMASVGCVPKVIGAAHLPDANESSIYVANHQSYTDIFSLGWLNRRLKFVSKIEILRIPIIGWAMSFCKHVPLRRGDRRGQVEAYKAMLQSLKDGNSLVIFPEGTRSQTGKMRKFQSGAFKASLATGAPIVPVTILGTGELMPPDAYMPMKYPKNGISIIVHPKIYPEGRDATELSQLAYAEINSALPTELQNAVDIQDSPQI